ncbi:MerR family transcriptional regulator [Bacillus sp. 03113]|uniref:MerR family transcriptional regulator n=1 Tax=Bacillus sp. 03113 TaxID=2578211 RepID=UPI00215C37CA|nr:MerR family transcriptional regulator [Bacillus sp. 03113]
MEENQFMTAYSISEVSKKIDIPSGTIRQWEKDLDGLLIIPRSKQGSRFFTDYEIGLLEKIKQMRDKNLGMDMIRDLFEKHLTQDSEVYSEPIETSYPFLPELKDHPKESSVSVNNFEENIIEFFDAMENYRETLLKDVKEEIRNGIQNELLVEVKKEISNGSLQTIKRLSDSIYKSTEKTNTGMVELTKSIEKTSEHNSEVFKAFSNTIKDASETASEELKEFVQRVSDTTELTNQEINSLVEAINKERRYYIETIKRDREQLKMEIKQREDIFQDLVQSFRKASAAEESEENEKKWWAFWK